MNVVGLVQDSQDTNKAYAAMFAPFWNEIIKSLREEDFISNRLVKGNLLLDNRSIKLTYKLIPEGFTISILLFVKEQRNLILPVFSKNLCGMTGWIF